MFKVWSIHHIHTLNNTYDIIDGSTQHVYTKISMNCIQTLKYLLEGCVFALLAALSFFLLMYVCFSFFLFGKSNDNSSHSNHIHTYYTHAFILILISWNLSPLMFKVWSIHYVHTLNNTYDIVDGSTLYNLTCIHESENKYELHTNTKILTTRLCVCSACCSVFFYLCMCVFPFFFWTIKRQLEPLESHLYVLYCRIFLNLWV